MTDTKQSTPQVGLQAQIQSLQNDEDFAAALDLLKTSGADLDPGFVALERAAILHRLDRNTEALAELDKAPFAHNHLRFWRIRTRVLIALGHLDQAETVIRDKDLGGDEIGGGLMFSLGRTLLEDRQFERAASHLSKAHLTGFEAPALVPLTAQATLLAGDVEGFNAVLDTQGKDTSANMVNAVRRALALLLEGTPDVDMVASSDKLIDCTLQSLHRLDEPMDALALADILRPICDRPVEKKINQRLFELMREKVPAAISDIQPRSTSNPPPGKRLPEMARWLGIPDAEAGDWAKSAWSSFLYKKEMSTIVFYSPDHRDQLAAAMPPADWSEVRACNDAGQPVLLIGLHSHFRPAAEIELLRLNRNAKLVTNGWTKSSGSDQSPLLFPPPTRAPGEEANRNYTGSEITRNILRELGSGGVVLLAVSGDVGARPRYLENHRLHVKLPPPHWELARHTGAAVFGMESCWRNDTLSCGVTRWDVPDGSDPQAEEALWYDHIVDLWRDAALADPRNVLPAGWFLGRGKQG